MTAAQLTDELADRYRVTSDSSSRVAAVVELANRPVGGYHGRHRGDDLGKRGVSPRQATDPKTLPAPRAKQT